MTAKQRVAVEAQAAAREAGMSLSDYARVNGLVLRQLYDALAALRRREALPGAAVRSRQRRSRDAFLPVHVVERPALAIPTRGATVCRLVHASGIALECGAWRPVEWLRAVWGARSDAAS
jgi:hypothetical protein